uniref:GPCR family 2 latrophilin C-terminal domain-containing protein n=1 Tax=Amphiprion percula TaxID=161767 RepID=A0A3P8S1Q0_AMPPE
EAVGVRAPGDLGGLNLDDAAFEKMIISEIVHNNLRPRGAPKGRDTPRERDRALPPQTRVTVDRGGGGSGSEDDAIVADHAELLLHPHHKEALEAPLLPQRTHSLLYSAQKAPRRLEGQNGHGSETVTAVEDMGSQSPTNNRDSLYTSMPNLRDSPSPSASPYPPEEEEELSPSPQSESEDAYHKSMPELGDAPQPLSYYHINRGTSDGCIIPPNSEDCAQEGEAPSDGQMQLITSL